MDETVNDKGKDAAENRVEALVLAGRRRMEGFGGDRAPHKALLDLAGVPMIARVISTLASCPSVDRIVVAIDDPAAVEGLDVAAELIAAGRLRCRDCGSSPADSVARHLADGPRAATLLVTTADHPLLTSKVVEEFLEKAAASKLAVIAAMVSARTFRARYPDLPRTFIPLKGESYSGANLFAFRGAAGRSAAEFWRRVEGYRKTPWKMAALLGPKTLLAFALRRLDLSGAMARVSELVGCPVGVIELADAECAIDVDSPGDAEVVEGILRARS